MSSSNGGVWKKPNETLKKFKVKRTKSKKDDDKASGSGQCLITGFYSKKPEDQAEKNPFAKRRKTEDAFFPKYSGDSTSNSTSSPAASCSANTSATRSFFDNDQQINDSLGGGGSEDSSSRSAHEYTYLNEDSIQRVFTETPAPKEESTFTWLPHDWTLKIKARFLSTSKFDWCNRVPDMEEDEAIETVTSTTLFQNIPSEKPTARQKRVRLVSKMIYYEFPMVYGRSVFPRYSADAATGINSSYQPRDESKKAFFESWFNAFKSAFKAVLRKRMSYCYVCAQEYTALFRNPLGSETECLITPASEGLKKELCKEGIKLTNPDDVNFKSDLSDSAEMPESLLNLSSDEDDLDQCDLEEEISWMDLKASVSMDHNDLLTDRSRGSSSTVMSKTSAVLVRGTSNLQMLYNYLLNSRISITISGHQANLPPTILSPQPFFGSTLMRLKFRSGKMKTGVQEDNVKTRQQPRPSRGGMTAEKWGFDLSGPIMPHHVIGLVQLFNLTQASYSVALSAYHYTGPFNNHKVVDPSKEDVKPMELIRQLKVDRGEHYNWTS